MVIPLGDGGPGPGMMADPIVGPPPEYLIARFKKIKVCLLAQIFGSIIQLGSGIPLQPSNSQTLIINSLDLVLVIITGIFLLKDDPQISHWHNCLVRTFCQNCEAQCQGGMPCLCSWFFICFLNVITALIPSNGSQLSVIIAGMHEVLEDNTAADKMSWGFAVRSIPWYMFFFTFFASEVIVLFAQLIGGWHGYKGFQGLLQRHQEMQAHSEGAGEGYLGAGTGGTPMPGQGFDGQQSAAPPPQQQQQQGFRAFQGDGHRLGG